MRRLLAFLCAVGLALAWARTPLVLAGGHPRPQFGSGGAQPPRSPHEATDATVAGAHLSIEYGRPSVRGRKIFGGLVPYDYVWCPGADRCTKLTTSRDLRFGSLTLPAGEYTLWMRPTEAAWSLIFNSDARAFHIGRRPQLDVGTVELHKQTLAATVEQLTFTIEAAPSGQGGAIAMAWDRTRVSAAFVVGR